MHIQVISIFPEMFSCLTDHGVVGRAIEQNVLSFSVINPRDFANDKRSTVDDRPYGGGPGMVMTPEPLLKAINFAKQNAVGRCTPKVIYLSPQGERFNHHAARQFSSLDSIVFLAGRYEGIDERVIQQYVDEQWSIGDYVLSGGELPAMVMIDAIARLLPESLGNALSAQQDSFADGLLDCPHYTRPESFNGHKVPDVLLSGDHQAIKKWRMKQSLGRTWLLRPELLNRIELDKQQLALLDEFKREL